MIDKIKSDRLIQVMLVLCFVLMVFIVVIVGATFRRLIQPSSFDQAPTPILSTTPPDSGLVVDKQRFEGQGNKVETFTIYREGLVYFTASQNADRPTRLFSVWLKNSNGENIKLLMMSQGTSTNEVVENLPPGQYILEITGDIWAITVLHDK